MERCRPADHRRLYGVWDGMKRRCYDKKHDHFKAYGGRGIKVCDEWKSNFKTFAEWALENGYDETAPYGECTLDRIDVNGNYEPSNCRFVSLKEQNRNRRDNKYVEVNGRKVLVMNLCKEVGLDYHTLQMRLIRGWSIEKAINTPLQKQKSSKHREKPHQKHIDKPRQKRRGKPDYKSIVMPKRTIEGRKMERLMKPSEARQILACSTAEIYRIIKEGEIPSIRRGNRWYIVPADLECYIEKMKGEGA